MQGLGWDARVLGNSRVRGRHLVKSPSKKSMNWHPKNFNARIIICGIKGTSVRPKQKFPGPPLLGSNTTAQDSKVNVLDDDHPGDGEHDDYDHGDHDGGCHHILCLV